MIVDGVSTAEIIRRVESLAAEYNSVQSEAMARLLKMENIMKEIRPLVMELRNRGESVPDGL